MSDFAALLSIEEALLFGFPPLHLHLCFCGASRDSDDCNSRVVNKVDFDHPMHACVDHKLPTRQVNRPYCLSNLALTYSQNSQHHSQHPHKRANEGAHHLQKRRAGRDVGGKDGRETKLHGAASQESENCFHAECERCLASTGGPVGRLIILPVVGLTTLILSPNPLTETSPKAFRSLLS